MKLEISEPELDLLQVLLVKELEETRVEIHHARNMDYKIGLEEREGLLRKLMGRLERVEVRA